MENECFIVINLLEVVEEKVFFFDWFGLWFGFYKCS